MVCVCDNYKENTAAAVIDTQRYMADLKCVTFLCLVLKRIQLLFAVSCMALNSLRTSHSNSYISPVIIRSVD